MANTLPTWGEASTRMNPAGAAQTNSAPRPKVPGMIVGSGYFRALGATVLAGREFNNADDASAVHVAVVNQRFAAKLWPGEDPLGKRLRIYTGTAGGPMPEAWMTIVGVVSNIIQDDTTRQEFLPLIYMPYRQRPDQGMWMLARTRVPPGSLISAFRHEVQRHRSGPLIFTDPWCSISV